MLEKRGGIDGRLECEAMQRSTDPVKELDDAGHFGAVGGATALALAAVLTLAAVVAGLAAALPFAVVLSLTGVLGCIHAGALHARLESLDGGAALHWAGGVCSHSGAAHQTGESCAEKECIDLVLHDDLTSWDWVGATPAAGDCSRD